MPTKQTQNPDELPTVTGKRRTVKVRANLIEFGRTWRLIRPNQIVANKLSALEMTGADGEELDEDDPEARAKAAESMSVMLKYFAAHVHPDERAEFLVAAGEDDTFEMEDFVDLMSRMTTAVYDGMEMPDPKG